MSFSALALISLSRCRDGFESAAYNKPACRQIRRASYVLFATLLTFTPLISFATNYYTATADLSVRVRPGTGYSVSFTLKKGDEVAVLSDDSTWYKVKYEGKTGYVHSKYLKYSRTTSDIQFNLPLDQPQQSDIVMGAFISLALLVVGFVIFRKISDRRLLRTVTRSDRGTRTERELVLTLLKSGIPAQRIFHDLYLKTNKGTFSQIDLVVVGEVGVIVFEVKDYSGWIYGTGSQLHWTQVLAYGKRKYRVYNPIRQNHRHMIELRNQLGQFEGIPFYSVVVFYGDCVLKDIKDVPYGAFVVKSKRVLKVMKAIVRDNEPVRFAKEDDVFQVLNQAVTNGGIKENRVRHIASIEGMLGNNRIFS